MNALKLYNQLRFDETVKYDHFHPLSEPSLSSDVRGSSVHHLVTPYTEEHYLTVI